MSYLDWVWPCYWKASTVLDLLTGNDWRSPILQIHSNSRMDDNNKETLLSSGSAGGAVSEQLESDNQLQPDPRTSTNQGLHPELQEDNPFS